MRGEACRWAFQCGADVVLFWAVLFWVRVFASDLSAALNTLNNLCATADKLRAARRAVGCLNAVLFWVCVGCVLWAAVIIGAAVVFEVSSCGAIGAIRMRSACVRACVRAFFMVMAFGLGV